MIHKKSLFHSPTGLMKKSSLLLLVLVTAVLLMTSTAMAFDYSPKPPLPGGKIRITGTASSDEISNGQLPVSIIFETQKSVLEDGTCPPLDIDAITIPDGTESLSLQVEGVDNLDIKVYLLGIPIKVPDEYVTVTNNVASFSTGKIKSGTYKISMVATPANDAETVSFRFGGEGYIGGEGEISSDGSFVYEYDLADDMPEDLFTSENELEVTVGGETQHIPLGTTDDTSDDDSSSSSSSSSSSTKKSSSHTGTDLQTVDAATLGNDEEESSGVGDEVEKILHNADMESTQDESSEGDSDTGEVDGYILENKSLSGIQSKIPELGVMGAVVGVLCLGAIFIGFRKNRYK
ncbi:MAG: hypothetical protein PWQ75_965 [Methanolobus sp.]|jgi:hypothetical protein|uniref:hypothetical protein n=1 Tax=Methanolobus sp. TaxID=1874737 RepID=UPI0024AC2001|nr:hypothetical protein [Methanolobus sp.]MDI3485050.1 hypothetical protein [Methanolobus sp.]MDK2831213.1 hypothetical protein [Methanolobus sp.]